jgi:chromatin modification-related protein VID21
MPNGQNSTQVAANAMAMRMAVHQQAMQQSMSPRPGIPIQTAESTQLIQKAKTLQEQQRMLQTRQQVPQQQNQQPQQQQFHHLQQFAQQSAHSGNVNIPHMNGTANNPAILGTIQAANGLQNSFQSGQAVSSSSPRLGQPNHLSNGVIPTISSIQTQIQRNNPTLSPEQVNEMATDRLRRFQQQHMSQMAMNAAAGNVAAVQSNIQVAHDSFQANGQHGMPSMNVNLQNAQAQSFSSMIRVPQGAAVSSPVANGPGHHQQSRSGTPQTQRSGSVQNGAVAGASKSPHAAAAQIANS